MRIYLGLDGGGSKTAAVVLDESGLVLGRGYGGSCNVALNPDSVLIRSVRRSVQEAVAASNLPPGTRFAGVCAGVAGASVEPRLRDFERILGEEIAAEQTAVEPDYLAAYWGATLGEPGIIVVAGTGAVSFGRNDRGQTHREDGLGYLLGDRGSGFNLGIYALQYTIERLNAGTTNALTEAVLQHTGATSPSGLLHWLYGNFSTARVASLAPVVGAQAEAGGPAARTLVAEMARRLRYAVRQVRHALWMPRDVPVYPLGGLWQLGAFFRCEFVDPQWPGDNETHLTQEEMPGGHFNLAEPKQDAAYGAALMALRRPA